MQLTFFLAAARAFIQQSAPDMLAWENREHAGRSYVRVAPTEMALEDFLLVEEREMTPPALHYVASGQGLTLSLSESVIQRALERQVARAERHAEGGDLPHDAAPAWLGQQLGLRVDRDVVSLIESGLTNHDVQPLQAIAWSNLPILDEWKRRWPDRDPLAVHQQLWGRQLLCPAGGGYRWNDEDGRMESTLYGHPGRPKRGPVLPVTAKDIGSAEFGLDFEDDGLRARVRLFRN